MKLLNPGKLCKSIFKLKENIFTKSFKDTQSYTIRECEFQKSIRGNSVVYDNINDVRYIRFAIKSFNTEFNELRSFKQISITNQEFEQIKEFINSKSFDINKRYDITFEAKNYRSSMIIMLEESKCQPKVEIIKVVESKPIVEESKVEIVESKPIQHSKPEWSSFGKNLDTKDRSINRDPVKKETELEKFNELIRKAESLED